MPQVRDNPDRDFLVDDVDAEILRFLLERSDTADLSDAATRERIGRVIARAAGTPPQSSIPQQQQQQQQRAKDDRRRSDNYAITGGPRVDKV